ncbi:Uncharacterised protein [Nocardia otitidiscaviarum]|uniref:Uncharacterized protein n=1 Tax=Nocardia otitidiscaviarum TaxID=1823 RepID=A0A379JH21_9NOCA|nr:hypothetical protein [Nocardia otitidiscaviarum]SUD47857.1 Uncharacterised protein [Nocardia otitidiscaviarum]
MTDEDNNLTATSDELAENISDTAGEWAERAGDAAGQLAEKASSAAAELADRAQTAAAEFADMAKALADRLAGEDIQNSLEQARANLEGAAADAMRALNEIVENLKNKMGDS